MKKNNTRPSFDATGLPPGLRISDDGEISGRLRDHSAGTYQVTVTLQAEGQTVSQSFTWTVLQ
jgi:hypothetical protein